MKKVGFIYHDMFLRHEMPPGHPESKDRLLAITETLKKSGMWEQLEHITANKADRTDIVAVHSATYFDKMLSFTGYFDADTFVSNDSVEAALYAAGAVNNAIDRCAKKELDRAFCAVRPPGHHAEANRAMGFCIFNNIAVGARHAQNAGYKRVFIIDFDVHHGNGTQHIFEEDDTVFYFSTHQYPHYPGTGSDGETGLGKGKGYTYNIPMHHGSGDREYLSAYQDTLPGLITNFDPDIVLVSAGYDLHSKDPLAGIRVSNEGIRALVRGILTSKEDVPYIFSLEGGYNLTSLSESVVITIEELFAAW
jgi:acetoin utilization deacetylase AcuC-like enzyme